MQKYWSDGASVSLFTIAAFAIGQCPQKLIIKQLGLATVFTLRENIMGEKISWE